MTAGKSIHRRVSDLEKDHDEDCSKGQQVLYDFLVEIDALVYRVKKLEDKLNSDDGIDKKVQQQLDEMQVKLDKKIDKYFSEFKEEFKVIIDPLVKIKGAWSKAYKTIFILLAAYALKDSPEALKIALKAIA